MSSVIYLREQFSKLQTEAERNMFCYTIIDVEYWSCSEERMKRLPENFLGRLLDNLRAALEEEGEVDRYYRFAEIVGQLYQITHFGMRLRAIDMTPGQPGVADLVRHVYQHKEKLAALLRLSGR